MAKTRLKSLQVTHQTAGSPERRTLHVKLTEFVSVQHFGALGDGLTDDAPAIQKAINSGLGRIYFPSGTYMIGAGGLTGSSNQAWVGDGRARTFLKMKVPPTLDMVYFHTKSNFSIEGITFDGNELLTAGFGNFPSLLPCVHVSDADNFYVRDCGFSGFYDCGLLVNVVNNATIERNYVDRGSALTTPNHGIVVSGSVGGGESYLVTIRGNKCDHCQISIHAYNSIVSGNIVTAWGFSAGINTQATAASHDLVVSDNICYNSNQHSDSSPYLPAGIENWAPNSTITGNICYGNFGDGIDNGGASCIIADNICYNNMGYGIYNLYQNER